MSWTNNDSRVDTPARMESAWQDISLKYLSVPSANSVWRLSRHPLPSDPQQGWKLHLSATILNACDVLSAVGPYLLSRNILFKGPVSLAELSKLNSGIHYGYSQVGKCFTVYPNNHGEAVELANQLDRLTAGVEAPAIPFDQKFGNDGCVYYRYGAFKQLEKIDANGKATLCIEDLEGNLIPDNRYAHAAVPSWIVDPFTSQAPAQELSSRLAPPDSSYMVLRALSQRGKGGVYLALDLTQTYPRLCLLKQGRKNGEQAWDGSDGFSRITNEELALNSLAAKEVGVPKIFSTFTRGNSTFIATEFVEGETLQKFLSTRARRLSIRRILEYGIQIGTLLNQVHAAGWVWRDCKPANLIKTARGEIRPIDFESACRLNDSRPNLWATKAFSPPKTDNSSTSATPSEDLYSFGVLLYFLLWGMLPNDGIKNDSPKRRNGVPESLLELISNLLRENPNLRPDAISATRRLRKILMTLPSTNGAMPCHVPTTAHGLRFSRRVRSLNLGSECRSSKIGSVGSAVIGGKCSL